MNITNLTELKEAASEALRLKEEIGKLKAERKALNDDITAYLKAREVTSVTLKGTRVSYAPYSVTRFDVGRFATEHKRLYPKYLKTDWFTKLTITPKKSAKGKDKDNGKDNSNGKDSGKDDSNSNGKDNGKDAVTPPEEETGA